jgi:hypothetical protein
MNDSDPLQTDDILGEAHRLSQTEQDIVQLPPYDDSAVPSQVTVPPADASIMGETQEEEDDGYDSDSGRAIYKKAKALIKLKEKKTQNKSPSPLWLYFRCYDINDYNALKSIEPTAAKYLKDPKNYFICNLCFQSETMSVESSCVQMQGGTTSNGWKHLKTTSNGWKHLKPIH